MPLPIKRRFTISARAARAIQEGLNRSGIAWAIHLDNDEPPNLLEGIPTAARWLASEHPLFTDETTGPPPFSLLNLLGFSRSPDPKWGHVNPRKLLAPRFEVQEFRLQYGDKCIHLGELGPMQILPGYIRILIDNPKHLLTFEGLDGLQHARGLSLELRGGARTNDTHIIQRFSNWFDLELYDNLLADTQFLAECKNLRRLHVHAEDLSGIGAATTLEELRVRNYPRKSHTEVDIGLLSRLKNLKRLTMWPGHFVGANLNTIPPKLTLLAANLNVDSLEGIQRCRQLEKVHIGSSTICDWTPLTKLPQLKQVTLKTKSGARVPEFSNLQDVTITTLP